MNELPICYVKSTILCIDDDVSITESLNNLINKQYNVKCFNKVNEAVVINNNDISTSVRENP